MERALGDLARAANDERDNVFARVVQASPNAGITDPLLLGDVRISAGASFTMTIPTPLQTGQMFMSAQFQSRNIPPTKFAAAIAAWQ